MTDALDKLITAAKRGGATLLKGGALRALERVLDANDAEPDPAKRVRLRAFLRHLKTKYKLVMSDKTLTGVCQRQLGRRSWSQK